MIKLGVVLPSFMYNDVRRSLATAAFRSLARTEGYWEQKAKLLLLVKHGHENEYPDIVNSLAAGFDVVLKTDEGLNGTEQTLAFGTQWLLDNTDVDYVTWMGDDALFHRMWLFHLAGLIHRHPTAKSWSVYRSAYEWIHKSLSSIEYDVMVRSICGHGMTFTRQEWTEWGIKFGQGSWEAPDGDTLDLLHVYQRPGERWVTRVSFVQHTGKSGVHCSPDTPEYARDFQGEG
jgi:hypothetical protein